MDARAMDEKLPHPASKLRVERADGQPRPSLNTISAALRYHAAIAWLANQPTMRLIRSSPRVADVANVAISTLDIFIAACCAWLLLDLLDLLDHEDGLFVLVVVIAKDRVYRPSSTMLSAKLSATSSFSAKLAATRRRSR